MTFPIDNYPPGAANDPNAPYNQVDYPTQEREVLVQALVSVKVDVEGVYNEDGDFEVDTEDLENKVTEELDNKFGKENVTEYEIIDY